MKKLLYLLCLGALTFVACEKELSFVENNEPETVVLTFSSERPQLEPTTKTAWDSQTKAIVWTTGDKIRVGYTLNGNWMGQSDPADEEEDPKFYKSEAVSIDGTNSSIGTFKVPMGNDQFINPSTSGGDYQFFSIYPGELRSSSTISKPDAVTVSLPTTQTPGVNTFDPSTDVMVGKSDVETLSGLPTTDPITLKWVRLVGHADLTFSNMAFDGAETVRKITLTFNDEAKVAGSFSIDIPNRTAGAGDANAIVLEGNGITVSGTSVKAWASVLPTTFTALDVEINTDKATYTRSISNLNKTFVRNRRNILTINMSSAQRTVVEPDRYVLYSGDLTEGDYIIYGYSKGVAMKAEASSNKRLLYETVTPNNNIILNNDPSIVWHITSSSSYWTVYNADVEKYAAATGSKNEAQLLTSGSDDKSLWTISGTTTYDFINKARAAGSNPDNKFLRYNPGVGFACYGNGTGVAISLYKKDTRTRISAPATVSASVNSSDDHVIDVTFSTVSEAASYVIVATPTGSGSVVTKENVSRSPETISTEDGLAYSTEYTISVYAVPVNKTQYIESVATAAEGTVTTGQDNEGARWEIVSSISDIVAGEKYLLATNDKAHVFNGTITSGHLQVVDVAPENNKISISSLPSTAVQIEFVSTGTTNVYQLKVDSKYISASEASSGHFTLSTTPLNWTFSEASGGGLIASSSVDYKSVYIRSYNNNSFRSYNGLSGASIYLYRLVGNGGIIVETPSISPTGGTFTSAQTVSISCGTTGATIYYTLDGTDPNNSSSVYSAPLTVSSTTTVKAIAIKDGTSSAIASETYTITSGSGSVTFTPGTDTGTTSVTKSGISVTMTTMNNTSYYQVYANETMVVSSSSLRITSISFTCTASGTDKFGPGNASASVGNYSYSGNTGTWNYSTGINSVTINSTKQIRITSLTVTYE